MVTPLSATCLAKSPSRKESARPLLWTAGTVVTVTPPTLRDAPKRTTTDCEDWPPAFAIFLAKNEAISEPTKSWAFLATTIFTVLDFGVTLTEKSGLPHSPAFWGGLNKVPQMIAMHMGQQHCVDVSKARIVRSAHGAPGIVENPCAIRILENHRAVEGTEFVVVTAQRRDLDSL